MINKICTEYYYQLADGDPAGALINAIQFGDWEAFMALLSVQENINATDNTDCGWTPLMYAVHEECMEMVKVLVEAGADVNYRAVDPGEFALSLAAYGGHQQIFNYLEPLTLPELQKIAMEILKDKLENGW